MIKTLLKDTTLSSYIGLILIGVIASIYLYLKPDTIDISKTVELDLVLESKPDYSAPNGENVPKISFKCNGYKNKFDISHCALLLIDKQTILNLNSGDSLTLLVENLDLIIEPMKLVYNPITVCGIKIKQKVMLSISDYNSCEGKQWKKILYIDLIFLLALVIPTVIRLAKKINKRKPTE
jgi:hypothetical protein